MSILDSAARGLGTVIASDAAGRVIVVAILALTMAGCRGDGSDVGPFDLPLLGPALDIVRDPAAPPLALTDAAARVPDAAPGATGDAPCGYVDSMDTPLGPPDGQGFQVRWPFGRVSNRYDGKLHAGEDWLTLSGNSFGQPLHAVAHGEVAYAQPWGWGTDQGVIIVRHRFPPGRVDDDGRPLTSVLSFYGHVDPPSVAVVAGQCVVRGQRIAAIGKPRGRAHLHFEIRTHMPDTPGPGYWPTDPTRVGWHNPSAFLTTYRLRATAGVRWLAPFTATLTTALGRAADGRLVVQTDSRALAGLDVASGRTAWRIIVGAPIQAAVLDASGAIVYVAYPHGVAAYVVDGRSGDAAVAASAPVSAASAPGVSAPDVSTPGVSAPAASPSADTTAPLWHHPTTGRPALLALPEGGAAVAADGTLWALGSDGAERWRVDGVSDVTALAGSARWLVLAGAGHAGAWPSPTGDRTVVRPGLAGEPVLGGDGVFFRTPDGVTWLSLVAPEPPRIHTLAEGHLETGQIVGLPDGGALVAHRGPDVRRLLRFGPDGALVWERDAAALGRRLPKLVATSDGPFAIGAGGDIVRLNDANGAATRLFAGIANDSLAVPPFAAAIDGALVSRLPLGDGRLVAFEVGQGVAGW